MQLKSLRYQGLSTKLTQLKYPRQIISYTSHPWSFSIVITLLKPLQWTVILYQPSSVIKYHINIAKIIQPSSLGVLGVLAPSWFVTYATSPYSLSAIIIFFKSLKWAVICSNSVVGPHRVLYFYKSCLDQDGQCIIIRSSNTLAIFGP